MRVHQDYTNSYNGWYFLYMDTCVKNTHLLIQLKIIKSRKIIKRFISKHIWNTKYNIGRKMYYFRLKQDGLDKNII